MKASAVRADQGKLRELGVILLLLTVIFLFFSFTLRQGHGWGDDFAMYVHHAENIALHHPYADTGYIYNQREAWYGPRTYPPVFPLLLAPVISSFGLNFTAMKMEEVVAFAFSLLVIYFLFRSELKLPYMAALLIILGFNPTLWEIKDSVTSDYPFWLFFLLACLVIEVSPRTGKGAAGRGLLAGAVVYLAYGTRSIGLVMLLGLWVYEGMKYRRITPFVFSATVLAALLIVGQRVLLGGSESSYIDQFHFSPYTALQNIRDYAGVLAFFWPWSAGRLVAYVLFAVITVLSLTGVFQAFRSRRLRSFDVILLIYGLVILFWPGNQGMRFLLPMLPVYLAYALMGLSNLTWHRAAALRWGSLAFLTVWAVTLYAGEYRKREFVRIPETSGRPTFVALCAFVREHSRPQEVFVFYRARALSLFTHRPASVYDLDGTPAVYNEQWRDFRKINTQYIIYSPLFPPDREFLRPVLDLHPGTLEPVFQNADFTVYHLLPGN